MTRTYVADVMTTDVATVHMETSFKDIVETLARNRISGVPVLDAAGKVVGVVSEADLLHKEEFKPLYSDTRPRLPGRRVRAAGRRPWATPLRT